MDWTTEPITRNGYYFWRICYPGEPPVMEPFMVYELRDGSQRVQELSATREGTDRGCWLLSEWLYTGCDNADNLKPFGVYPVEFLFIGGLDTEWTFVRAFRELYHAAVSAHRDLTRTPDLSDNGKAVADELAAAINEIHKETD